MGYTKLERSGSGALEGRSALAAAAGGVDGEGNPVEPNPEPLKAFFSQSIPPSTRALRFWLSV